MRSIFPTYTRPAESTVIPVAPCWMATSTRSGSDRGSEKRCTIEISATSTLPCRSMAISTGSQSSPRRRTGQVCMVPTSCPSVHIRSIHERSRGTYGAPRIHAELHAAYHSVFRKRVARLMRAAGLAGRAPRQYRRTTIADPNVQLDDLVRRDFAANARDREWFGDITYIRTWEGLAVPGSHCRRVQSQDRRLGNGRSPAQ